MTRKVNPPRLSDLLDKLAALGVSVAGVDNYRAKAAALIQPKPALVGMLDLSPEELRERTQQVIANEVSRQTRIGWDETQPEAILAGEFADVMAADFDQIITQFQPKLSEVAAAGMEARGLGVTSRASYQSLFLEPRPARLAWLGWMHTHAPVLDEIRSAIAELLEVTEVLGPSSTSKYPDAAAFMIESFTPGWMEIARRHELARWGVWLDVASRLKICTLGAISDADRLRADGVPLADPTWAAIHQLAYELKEEANV